MAKVSMNTVRSLINYLSIQGITRELLLQKIELNEAKLNDSQCFMDTKFYEALFQLAEVELNDKTIGFKFGQAIEADRWGLLGYIAFTSPTLKSALEKQRKYQSLVGNIGTPIAEFNQDFLILKWLPSYQCNYHIVEEIITGWLAMAQKISLAKVQPLTIFFSHACQTKSANYQSFFNCDIKFNSDFNGVRINQSVLNNALAKVDSEINQLLCQHADKRLNQLVEQLPVEIITQFISNQLPLGVPEVEEAAHHLQISIRTLQRKLGEHQLTFTGLIDSIRKDLAISYLSNTSTKIIYISQMLGFSEQSAFQRAFKRWTQVTPKQFRDQS